MDDDDDDVLTEGIGPEYNAREVCVHNLLTSIPSYKPFFD